MAKSKWNRTKVTADEILDAVDTMTSGHDWHVVDLITNWTPSSEYIIWAKDSLKRGDAFGWDAAVCYAKRAVCRQIDAFVLANHCGEYIRKAYPEKIDILAGLGIRAPQVIHSFVIDPRNEIEHEYQPSNKKEATDAVELAEMYLHVTNPEVDRRTILSFGTGSYQDKTIRFTAVDDLNFTLTQDAPPFLYIDPTVSPHEALVLHPKDSEITCCSLKEFNVAQITRLVRKLRGYYDLDSHQTLTLGIAGWKKFKDDLSL